MRDEPCGVSHHARVGPQMVTGKQIVCLASINWEFNWQGHQEVMARFAAAGNTVLFIENTGIRMPGWRDLPRLRQRLRDWRKGVQGIRQVRENLYVCSPIVLPFPYSRIAQAINRWFFMRTIRRWTNLLGFERPIVWTFLPTRFSVTLIDELDPELLVYYCIADFEQVGPARKIRRVERQLLRRADVVFAQGEVIAQRCRAHHPYPVHIFPFGVSLERFQQEEGAPIPDDLRPIPSPRLGYVGALQRHVDGPLLQELANRHPDWQLVIVGPEVEEFPYALQGPNIHKLGARPHETIPAYIAGFDVCLIPYELNSYTQTVYPTKLTEYLIMGKPVVSTPLPEVLAFNGRHRELVSIGRTCEEFEAQIRRALQEEGHNGRAQERVEAATQQGWATRVEAMDQIMAARLRDSEQLRSAQWPELLRRYTRATLRRTLRLVIGCGLLYLGLFHTPALWWLASPLKIVESPVPADAIVVFAGGVGESGIAGQGYEERVQHAVELYQQGYAPQIIFSSGHTFAFRETDLMQALAISLGVPGKAIILENQAGNTVTNVQFTHDILMQHGWRKALLVSSPYHMRRAVRVWRKQAPEVTVISTPIPVSRFYGGGSTVQLKQIQAIFHEYLGILYYWWKGYL